MSNPAAAPASASGHAQPRGPDLRALYEDAAKRLQPLFEESKEQNLSTLMYLALHRLHKDYPELSQSELEALLMGLLNRRRGRREHFPH